MNAMRIAINLLSLTAFAAVASANYNDHFALRHRHLGECITKGNYCTADDRCCGKAECGAADDVCCIPEGVKGCDGDIDCCNGLACDSVTQVCGEGGADSGGRDCGIHADVCENSGDSNTCCGTKKYDCMVTPVAVPGHQGKTTCCIKIGLKGCSFNYHCCTGSCDAESRCVDNNGEYPDDSPGGRTCLLKGETCTNPSECCGSKRYDCNVVGRAAEATCCIKSGNKGCEDDLHCCSGTCNMSESLCY